MGANDPDTAADLAERRGETYEYYEAAEDSAVLAGAAAEDLAESGVATVLDVGTGSGYVGARLREATGARVVGVDVNPAACRRALENGVESVRGDLVAPFADDAFDAVAFNPPYLPASAEAEWDDWFEVAVTGGETGRELVERFLEAVGRVLRTGGAVYLLVSSLTGVDAVVEHAAAQGFSAAALTDATYPGETLTALKLVR
ncbi:MAG: HemK2/MTQ2 family protein methyltransferase [Halobacteriales archaeon]|nr:HemK2/MTQ2 family protein methyltransferase [Halobacteriales archaeon]